MQICKYTPTLYGAMLDLDLNAVKKSCDFIERQIELKINCKEEKRLFDKTPLSTQKFTEYNLLLSPLPEFHTLYFNIQKMFYDCASEYYSDRIPPHRIQSWLNYYRKGDYINWHTHWPEHCKAWHGFFCVDVGSDSFTSYTWDHGKNILNVESKNNLLVLGQSNDDRHKSSEWNNDLPRITIAFDIVPESIFNGHPISDSDLFNHWIPI